MSTSSSSSWEKVLDSIVGYREVGHGARSSQLLEVWYYLWLKEKKEQGKKAQGGGVGGFLAGPSGAKAFIELRDGKLSWLRMETHDVRVGTCQRCISDRIAGAVNA